MHWSRCLLDSEYLNLSGQTVHSPRTWPVTKPGFGLSHAINIPGSLYEKNSALKVITIWRYVFRSKYDLKLGVRHASAMSENLEKGAWQGWGSEHQPLPFDSWNSRHLPVFHLPTEKIRGRKIKVATFSLENPWLSTPEMHLLYTQVVFTQDNVEFDEAAPPPGKTHPKSWFLQYLIEMAAMNNPKPLPTCNTAVILLSMADVGVVPARRGCVVWLVYQRGFRERFATPPTGLWLDRSHLRGWAPELLHQIGSGAERITHVLYQYSSPVRSVGTCLSCCRNSRCQYSVLRIYWITIVRDYCTKLARNGVPVLIWHDKARHYHLVIAPTRSQERSP